MKKAYEKGKNPLLDKSLELSLFIAGKVKEYKNEQNFSIKNYLCQISRSSHSIAANASETQAYISARYKHTKLNICLGECYETRIHAEALYKVGVLTETEYNYIVESCDELVRILSSAIYNLYNLIKNEKK